MKSKKSKKLKSIRKASRDAFLDLHKKPDFQYPKVGVENAKIGLLKNLNILKI